MGGDAPESLLEPHVEGFELARFGISFKDLDLAARVGIVEVGEEELAHVVEDLGLGAAGNGKDGGDSQDGGDQNQD